MLTELGPSSWYQKGTETLFEGADGTILACAGRRQLTPAGGWTDEHIELARKFEVTFVNLNEASFGSRTTAEFLLDLPALRELHIALGKPKDLSAIAGLRRLEYLGIMGNVVSPRHDPPPSVDFSPLKALKKATMQLCPQVQSIFACANLEELELWNDLDPPLDLLLKRNGVERMRQWKSKQRVEIDLILLTGLRSLRLKACPEIRDLDLSHQSALGELHLDAVPKLRIVRLHPNARVRNLKINRCGAYRIDWERIGPDLEELELVGPLMFPLQDVLKAPHLRALRTHGIRKFPPLKFLLELPKLRTFSRWSTPGGPKLPDEDREIIQTINRRGGALATH